MAISFNLSISEENLEKISREKSTYLSSISFIVNGNSFVFNNVPYIAESRQIIKNYEYNGTQLDITITIGSTLIDLTEEIRGYNAVGVVDYKINGNEYSYNSENDVVHLGWSIENSKAIRDNDGYALASTAGAEPDILYYELTEDETVTQGKDYYQLEVVGETINMVIVDPPPSNPKEASLYEAVNQTYYTLTSQTSETGNFIRLDKYGLYGVARENSNNTNYTPRGIKQIQDDAMFSLTWNGYTLRTSHPDGGGYIRIGASDDIVVSTISTYIDEQGVEQRVEDLVAKLGYLSEDDLESAGGTANPLCGLYGIFSKNIYIGDGENFLAYYNNSDSSTFEVRTDNFYFNTVDIDGETSIQDITQKTRSLVDEMGVLYRKLDAWIEVGDYTEEGQSTTVALKIADHNNPSQASELVLTSDKMIFKKNEKDVAYISARDNDYGFSIKDGFIDKKLQFNDYAFITRDNGNFSLKYIGV